VLRDDATIGFSGVRIKDAVAPEPLYDLGMKRLRR
jgi:hypothetical protein